MKFAVLKNPIKVSLPTPDEYGMIAAGAFILCFVEALAQVGLARAGLWRRCFGFVTLCLSSVSKTARFGFCSFATLRTASLSLKLVRPRTHRALRADARVYPVLGSYALAKIRIRKLPQAQRDTAWDKQHAWAAERARRLVADFGGFYTKLGQITGTCSHLMPPEWVEALSETMENNAPVQFQIIRKILLKELKISSLEEIFQDFDEIPVATASVAQVHKAKLRKDGTIVAVKVNLGRKKLIMSDVHTMRTQSIRAKKMGLDAGLDMPTIMEAYERVVPEEFDFEKEAQKIHRCHDILQRNQLDHLLLIPQVFHATRNCLIMSWIHGPKFSQLFIQKDADVTAFFEQVHTTPSKVFSVLHRAYGAMLFDPSGNSIIHCDPHPGNLKLAPDGRIALLDFGQTKQLSPRLITGCARACVAMARGDIQGLSQAINALDEFTLIGGSPTAWALISYTFFDTRWTPLADVNIYDLDRSILARGGGFERNSADAFPLMRVSILMRGLMNRCGLHDVSMIDAWEPYALRYLTCNSIQPSHRMTKIIPITHLRRARRRLKSAAYSILPDSVLAYFLFGDTNNSDYLATLRKLQRQGQQEQLAGRSAAIAAGAH